MKPSPADQSQPLLLTAPYVVTMDPARRVLRDGGVYVAQERIRAVGPRDDLGPIAPEARRLAFEGHALLPGFVDGHLHALQGLARGLADDIDEITVRWGWDRIFPWEAALGDEEAYVSALLAAVELVRSGVTCFADPGGFQMDAVARAVADAGVRALLAVGAMDRWSPDFPLPPGMVRDEPTAWALEASERLVRDWHGARDDRIRCGYSIRVLMNASETLVREIGRRAHERGLTVQLHLAVSADRVRWIRDRTGKRPVEYLEHLGVLGPNWLLAHLGWIDEAEIPLLRARDVKVCHCPGSSMHNARGAISRGKFPELLAAGVTVCLGADAAACNNSLDMFRTMYLACLAHKEARLRLDLFPPETVLEMATLGGARAVGWEDAVGSLEVGKRADVIAVDLRRPNMRPVHDFSLVPNLVYAGSADNVTFAMVDGRVLMQDRRILFTDEARLLERAQALAERLLARMPFKIQPRWPVSSGGARAEEAAR